MVVGLDVGADLLAGLVERLELLAPDAALLELAEPGLDEGLALGVAVAAAAMRDAQAREDELERAGGERRAVVGAQRQRAGRDRALGGARSMSVIASVARQRSSRCQPTISRVQQSMAAIR